MQAHTLTVGDRVFRLRTPCDLAALSASLTDAVRHGGGMVSLPVAGESAIEVLVSPGLVVLLETHDVDPLPGTGWADPVPWLGIDDLDF
jgi:hypothetical protein